MELGAGMGVGCARKVQASQITTVTPPLLLRENPKFSSIQLFPQNTCAISARREFGALPTAKAWRPPLPLAPLASPQWRARFDPRALTHPILGLLHTEPRIEHIMPKPKFSKKAAANRINGSKGTQGNLEPCAICQQGTRGVLKREGLLGVVDCPAKHDTFCYSCIFKWSKHEKVCPMCRGAFTKVEHVPACALRKRKLAARKMQESEERTRVREQERERVRRVALTHVAPSPEMRERLGRCLRGHCVSAKKTSKPRVDDFMLLPLIRELREGVWEANAVSAGGLSQRQLESMFPPHALSYGSDAQDWRGALRNALERDVERGFATHTH